MPMTLTLKNIPDEVYSRLKIFAELRTELVATRFLSGDIEAFKREGRP